MTVESNYANAIATLSDWLKNPAPGFQPMRGKTNRALYSWFFPRFEQWQVIAKNSDWFVVLFTPNVIGLRNDFGVGFLTVIWKPL